MKYALSFCLLLASVPVFAQDMQATYVRRMIDCESIGRKARTCASDLDSTFSIQLANQLSSDACVQGQSFQINGNTVVVSNGCRAEFAAEGLTSYPQADDQVLGSVTSVTVDCESDGGRVQSCDTGLERVLKVVLTQQLSHRPCVENQDYKIVDNMIQVFNGCRAEFMATGIAQQAAPQPQPYPPQPYQPQPPQPYQPQPVYQPQPQPVYQPQPQPMPQGQCVPLDPTQTFLAPTCNLNQDPSRCNGVCSWVIPGVYQHRCVPTDPSQTYLAATCNLYQSPNGCSGVCSWQ